MTPGERGGATGRFFSVGNPVSERLCANLNAAWFPVDPGVLQQVRSRLKDGGYEGSSALLVEDIRKDYSLFVYCVRELSRLLSGDGDSDPASTNPIALLRHAPFGQLSSVVSVAADDISLHSLGADMGEQARQMFSAMMSAGAAETLSCAQSLDPESAFSCALFRQLGLTLVAWNYPHVFSRAVANLRSDESLDTNLGRVLGVTPSVLGLTLARKWRLSKQILCGMGAQLEELPPDVLLVGEKLRRVCEAGEALARASDPEHYPTARMDWDLAQHEIHQMIGPEGLAQIFVNIERRCQAYKRFCPELQPDRLVHEVHAQIGYSFGRACYERNPHIPKCPQFLREQLGELYSKLDGFSVRSELIQILIQQSALAVGFKRGAVFMLEPESRVLSPRLVFGDFRMFQHRPRNLRLSHDNESPIVEAFNSGSILMAGGSVLFVAGTLGNLERLGVLYMEIPREVQQARGATAIDCFCAINQALSDCLTIQ